jgi:hypothetical protein
MWATLFLLLIVLTGAATWAWTVREQAIPFMTMLSVTGWSLLATVGGQITIYHDDGSSTTVAEPAIQYVFVGLAVLSFFALVLWYFGEYPVQAESTSRNDGDRIGVDGDPNSEGV